MAPRRVYIPVPSAQLKNELRCEEIKCKGVDSACKMVYWLEMHDHYWPVKKSPSARLDKVTEISSPNCGVQMFQVLQMLPPELESAKPKCV